jgi:hypothetical protein
VVLRIVVVGALILALGQSRGIPWLDDDACAGEDCSDSSNGLPCPPDCPTCACAPSLPTIPTADLVVIEPIRIARRVDSAPQQQFVCSPDPREIFHIPRPIA